MRKNLVELAEKIITAQNAKPELPIPYAAIEKVFDLYPRRIGSALAWVFQTKLHDKRHNRMKGTLHLHCSAYKTISTESERDRYTTEIIESLSKYYD
ncbi:hypothetical protein V6259_12995 [Marinomonas sp. TI.3.20]|uniref:hypothetical protein n=1 Tax=Marinomonas sp. TI.3.20 TaxID=3121296 RepID=UPI00311D8385